MMKEDVKHIFDRSTCLNKRQIEAYLKGNMITEEIYAVEHHINGCPLCSMALDGMQLRKDALEVMSNFNSDFLKSSLEAVPPPSSSSSAASYVKNLKPKEIGAKIGSGSMTNVVKLVVGVAAVVGILWFIQSLSKNSNSNDDKPAEVVTAPKQEEQSVVVEEPLMADTQAVAMVDTSTPVETTLEEESVAPPPVEKPKPEQVKPPVVTKTPPAPTKAVVTTKTPEKPKTPPTTKVPPPTTKTPPVTTTKPFTIPTPVPVPPPPQKEVAKPEPPKPQPVKQEPEKPKAEEPKPEPKPAAKEDDLPSDPLAAGKALMDKRNYNAAITRMRTEMRSSNKNRRQEAVMLVAKCYQQMGNKERAKELLSSIVDEGGPEKKNAKKMLKEVDKNATE